MFGRKLVLRLVAWTCIVIMLLKLTRFTEYVYRKLRSQADTPSEFIPYNDANVATVQPYNDTNVATVHWVCIESRQPRQILQNFKSRYPYYWYVNGRKKRLHDRECDNIQPKIITIYKKHNNISSKMRQLAGFQVSITNRKTLPKDFTLIENSTAYFLGIQNMPFEPENFFHFIKQIFIPFFYMAKMTNQLKPGADNVLFHPRPFGRCPGKFVSFNHRKYQPFYEMLHRTKPLASVFEESSYPEKVCYKNAVFTDIPHLKYTTQALEYILQKLKVDKRSCQKRLLTIIQRGLYRKILNIDDLEKEAVKLGYRVKIATMEKMTLNEQAQLIYCTETLVGVTGAGLMWAYFMRDHSAVVEIAWPQNQWPFFFTAKGKYMSGLNGTKPLNWSRLTADKCYTNTSYINSYYKDAFSMPGNFTKQESESILKDPRNNAYSFKAGITTVAKLCDITIKPEDFVKAVKEAVGNQNLKTKHYQSV